jgi:Rieske Fe-S protein
MAADDKYPESSERRRFVKGVVGSAALAGVGTATAATINSATSPSGAGGGITQFFGVENIAGPAPRAMPQIPIEIDDEGFLRGLWPEVREETQEGRTVKVAETEIAGYTYSSEWFQYCGVQTYPGVQPDADQDNYFRYTGSPPYEWQQEEVEGGDRVNVEDFQDYEEWGNDIGQSGIGKPAMATWRSQDVPPSGTMPVQIIRSPLVEEAAGNDDWLGATTPQGFVANLDKCTHFCCVPGFKAYQDSAKFGGADRIYCQCHQSVYNPFNIVRESFVALPRPEDGEGGEGSE